MRRWGDGDRFLRRIEDIREREPDAAFRSNFIVGYPGETEADHDLLLRFVEAAQLDWCGFFAYSAEEGTHAYTLDGAVDRSLMHERLAELRELQDEITATRRDEMIGRTRERAGRRTGHRPQRPRGAGDRRRDPRRHDVAVGEFAEVEIVDALGPDLVARGGALIDEDGD